MSLMVHARVDIDAWEGPRGPIWVPDEWVVMGMKSRVVSARVTKYFVTIFSKTYNKYEFRILNSGFLG